MRPLAPLLSVLTTPLWFIAVAGPSFAAFNWCNQKWDATVEPKVLRIGQTGNVKFTFYTSPDSTRMELRLLSGGSPIPLAHPSAGVWTVEVPAAKALEGYQLGLAHNFFGRIYEYDGETEIGVVTNLIANVQDETMPLVPVRTVAGGQAQMTRHVLNMRDDTAYFWGTSPAGPPVGFYKRFYGYRPDDFDFLAVVGHGLAFENRYYFGVRQSTHGLGSAISDNGAAYGSTSKLQGVVSFPNDNLFDLAETGFSHELGHRWCCFVKLPTLADEQAPHWPMGDIAYGMMGITDPNTKQGLQFPYSLIPQSGGAYQTRFQPYATEFNDVELYLMGFLPKSDVATHFVFNDQNQTPGGLMHGPVTNLTVNDIVALNGQRTPAYGSAQTHFRVGTIVLSRNRLLEPYEMAHYEYLAARGESTWEMDTAFGVLVTKTKPFYLSTRTKGTLSTTVCSDCAGAASSVSSASFVRGGDLAPGSIASVFGFGLTDTVRIASAQPLPTNLDSTSVRVTDSAHTARNSPLFFISQGQINYQVPPGTVAGAATVDVIHDGVTVATGQVTITPVAPALFTANADGKGAPAANVIRVANAVVNYENPAAQCGATYGSCTPRQIDLEAANVEVFLEAYGTGIAGRTSLAGVTCTIGGMAARVDYAGPNCCLAGADQVNVLIPRSLIGRGLVDVMLTVDGKPANTVKINIK